MRYSSPPTLRLEMESKLLFIYLELLGFLVVGMVAGAAGSAGMMRPPPVGSCAGRAGTDYTAPGVRRAGRGRAAGVPAGC